MPAPAARMRSAMVPCGTTSSSMRPSRHSFSNTTGSAVRGNEHTILRTRPVSRSLASPTWPTPELLATTVKSLAPCSIRPSISAFGWPIEPKPPISTTEPSRMSAIASAMLCTILLIMVECCARSSPRQRGPSPIVRASAFWIPAFAGMSGMNVLAHHPHLRTVGERRHHLAGEARQAVAGKTAAGIEQHVFGAEPAQPFQLCGDLVRRAVERAFLARFAGVGIRHDARGVLRAGRGRGGGEAALRFQPALQRGLLVGVVLGDKKRARHADVHRIVGAAALFHLGLEDGHALGNRFERSELIEQQIVAALGDLPDRIRIAGGHPDRRMRLLRGRRLDDDVVETPEFSLVREALLRGPGLD